MARQPGEGPGSYADIKLPSADYIKRAFSGMLRRYAHGLKKHLDRLHEEHWGLPFACADHDLWSGPDLTPVLGFGLHFRDSDFNMIHAPLLASAAPLSHEAYKQGCFLTERLKHVYQIDKIFKYVFRYVSDSCNAAVAVSNILNT